jgi:MFS family permease
VSNTETPPPRLLTGRFVVTTTSTFAYFTALGMLVPTIPHFVTDELHGGGLHVGLAVGAFAVSAGALRPFAGRLGDQRGRRMLVVGGAAVFAGSVLGYLAASSVLLLVIARFAGGVGEAGFWVGSATTSQDLAPPDRRAEAASYYSIALYGGMALGPWLGEAIVDGPGFDVLWIVTAAVGFVACVLGLQTPARHGPPAARGPLLQRQALGPGVVLLLGLIPFMGFSAFLPSYGRHIGMDSVGPVFAFYAGIVLCIRIFGARLPDRLGLRALTSTALIANTLAATVVVVWAEPAGIWVAVAIYAVGMALLFPALFALVIGGVEEDERSRAVGTFSIFFDLAGGIGVPVLGAIVSVANERSAFAVTIAFGLLSLLALQRLVSTANHADMTAYAESIPP